MPENEDKYPTESGRRRFVKGVVGSAALSGVAAGTAATVNFATSPGGAGGGATEFIAIENTAGPAPRGMPVIPVEIDGGELKGLWPEVSERQEGGRTVTVAEQDVGGVTYSSAWFQYCGVQQYASTQPTTEANNSFLAGGGYDWMEDVDRGEPLTVDMFEDYEEWGNGIGSDGVGKPALTTWRSEDADTNLNAVVIRSPEIEEAAQNDEWLQASTDQGFMAYLNVCTHFCCIPGYKVLEESTRYDASDGTYCVCHQSVYDPFTLEEALFIARPRPEE